MKAEEFFKAIEQLGLPRPDHGLTEVPFVLVEDDWFLPKRDPDHNPDSQFDRELEQLCKDHDDYFWPHKNGCPTCGADAYVGFLKVECSNAGCQNFTYREGM